VLLKTTTERYPGLERHLVEHHPWDNPEMTAVQISAGSSPYLEWVRRATAGPH
jgi:periplasmic divalent cation tolerance protein